MEGGTGLTCTKKIAIGVGGTVFLLFYIPVAAFILGFIGKMVDWTNRYWEGVTF